MATNRNEHKQETSWTCYRVRSLFSNDDERTPEARQGHVMVELPSNNNDNNNNNNAGDTTRTNEQRSYYFLFGGRGNSNSQKPWKEKTKQERRQAAAGKKRQRRYLNDTWILTLLPADVDANNAAERNNGVGNNVPHWEMIMGCHNNNVGPSRRWSAAGFYYDNAVYIHGGRNLEDGFFLDDLWKFHLLERYWEKVSTKGRCLPPPVNGHSLVQYKDQAFLFGGSYSFGRDRNYLGDTYVLDLNTFEWAKQQQQQQQQQQLPPPIQKSPSPRYWHSVTNVMDGCYYLVGGFAFLEDNKEYYYDDVWKFNLEEREWTQIKLLEGSGLHRRNRCGAALVDSSTMVVFGGNYFGKQRRDVFLKSLSLISFDQQTTTTTTTTVVEIPCTEGNPLPVGHHTFLKMTASGDPLSFLVFGGEDGKQRFNDILIMSLVAG